MLCDLCEKREAKIFIKKIENGKQVDYNVCEVCASNALGKTIDFSDLHESIFHSLSDMLAGFSDIDENELEKELKCDECGLTSREFQETGKLGCDKCYQTFEDKLIHLLKRLQGSVQHAGKSLPGLEHRHEIDNLKAELQNCIEKEEYERAAVLRDKIRELMDKKNADGA